jgi:serpin B
LKDQLERIGMKSVFTDANLSGIDGKQDLVVSKVIHKAMIEVNEEGSEAAAATAVIIERGLPPVFHAVHPFFFFIRDNRNGMIIFVGHLNKL